VQPRWVGTWARHSRQDTAPTADCAGFTRRKQQQPSALRESVSLDQKRPHKGSAAIIDPLVTQSSGRERNAYSGFHSDVRCMCMGSACPPRKTEIDPIHLPRNRSSCLQMRTAVKSGTSRWRGTEVRRFVVGFSQIECSPLHGRVDSRVASSAVTDHGVSSDGGLRHNLDTRRSG
jgi:hypothetical protein